MLIAVAKSKDTCKQFMNSAAMVVRGLPLKLIDWNNKMTAVILQLVFIYIFVTGIKFIINEL